MIIYYSFKRYSLNKIDKILSLVEQKGQNVKILTKLREIERISETTNIEFECVCGNLFRKKYSQIRDQKYILCEKCVINNRVSKRRKDFNLIRNDFLRKGYKILDEQNYINNTTRLEVENEDGYKGFLSYQHLKRNNDFVKFSVNFNEKYFLHNIKIYEKINNYSSRVVCYNKNTKENSRTSIIVKCGCGEFYRTTYIYYLQKDGKCKKCANSLSSYESVVKKFLCDNNINFVSEYTFKNCRDKNVLPFDFYLPEYKIAIEVDGEGHYYPCHFNQINIKKAQNAFFITKRHNLIKNIYCMENDIYLLRLPYWTIKNSNEYKKIIISLLCSYCWWISCQR